MAHDVFISHSSLDKPYADAVCAKLEARGIRCWIAPRDILGGTDWSGAIIEAIEHARVMVLVFSAHANDSPQIKREVESAFSTEMTVVPVRIQEVRPNNNLRYFLGSPHWLDAITPPFEQHLDQIAENVLALLNRPPIPANAGASQPAPVLPESRLPTVGGRRITWNQLGVVSGVIIVALLIAWMMKMTRLLSHQTTQAPTTTESATNPSTGEGESSPAKPIASSGPRFSLVKNIDEKSHYPNSVSFNSSGYLLASVNSSDTIELWDGASGSLLKVWTGPETNLQRVAFSPDGNTVAVVNSGSEGAGIRLWDVGGEQAGAELPQSHQLEATCLAFSPDSRLLASCNRSSIIIWQLGNSTLYRMIPGLRGWGQVIAFSPKGDLIASGDETQAVKLWDVASGALKNTFNGQGGKVQALAFSPDGSVLASGGDNGSVLLWDVPGGTLKQSLNEPRVERISVSSLAFQPGGRLLAVGPIGKEIELWDTVAGVRHQTLGGLPDSPVIELSFSSDGRMLAAACRTAISLWKLGAPAAHADASPKVAPWLFTPKGTLVALANRTIAMAFSPDGRFLASGGDDKTLRISKLGSNDLPIALNAQGEISSVAYSPNGRWLASIEESLLRIVDPAKGTTLRTFPLREFRDDAVGFSPDSKYLVIGGEWSTRDGDEPRVWATDGWKPIIPKLHDETSIKIGPVTFSRNAVIPLMSDDQLFLYEVGSGEIVHSISRKDYANITDVHPIISHDGNLLAWMESADNHEQNLVIWDIAAGRVKSKIKSSNLIVLMFSSDDKLLFGAEDFDLGVKVFDVAAGRSRNSLDGGSAPIGASSDGKLLAATGIEQNILLWAAP